MVTKIESLRWEINSIDTEIARLIVRRQKISMKIMKMKKSKGLPAKDEERESEIISRLASKKAVSSELIRNIYALIFENAVKSFEESDLK